MREICSYRTSSGRLLSTRQALPISEPRSSATLRGQVRTYSLQEGHCHQFLVHRSSFRHQRHPFLPPANPLRAYITLTPRMSHLARPPFVAHWLRQIWLTFLFRSIDIDDCYVFRSPPARQVTLRAGRCSVTGAFHLGLCQCLRDSRSSPGPCAILHLIQHRRPSHLQPSVVPSV
jgi:hypothetical protein